MGSASRTRTTEHARTYDDRLVARFEQIVQFNEVLRALGEHVKTVRGDVRNLQHTVRSVELTVSELRAAAKRSPKDLATLLDQLRALEERQDKTDDRQRRIEVVVAGGSGLIGVQELIQYLGGMVT